MKIIILIVSLFIAFNVYGADTKVSNLDDITSPAGGDDMYIVDDPDGTPASKKISASALFGVGDGLDRTWTGIHDFGGVTSFEIWNGTDPDVAVAGQLAWDTDNAVLRASDDVGQIAVGQKIYTVQATIAEPDQLDASALLPLFSNESGLTFNIDEIKAWSDDDNVDFDLLEIDQDGGNSTTIEAVTVATDGTSIYYTTVASSDIDHTTIEDTHVIIFSADTGDTPDYLKITVRGWYDANI